MTIQEAIKSGRPFKRKGLNFYLECQKSNYSGNLCFYLQCTRAAYTLSGDDILADDWEVLEKWYEGNFKKKYPNGVLCKVGNSEGLYKPYNIKIITNYVKGDKYPFKSYYGNPTGCLLEYEYAEPVKPEEAPAIIGEDNDQRRI